MPDKRLREQVWRVEIGNKYRALARVVVEGDVRIFIWYWIGSHEAYNSRVR